MDKWPDSGIYNNFVSLNNIHISLKLINKPCLREVWPILLRILTQVKFSGGLAKLGGGQHVHSLLFTGSSFQGENAVWWWRLQMETFSALLAICAGNSPVPGEFPAQRPVTRSFNVFFDLRLNKRLSKQSRGWWLETPSRPLWRHRNMLPRFAIWSVNVLFVGLDYLTLNFSHNTCKMTNGLESTIIFCTYHASMLMWYMQTFMIINHGKFDYYLMIVKIYQAGLSKIFQETFCWKVAQLLYETNSYCSQILSTMDRKAHSI